MGIKQHTNLPHNQKIGWILFLITSILYNNFCVIPCNRNQDITVTKIMQEKQHCSILIANYEYTNYIYFYLCSSKYCEYINFVLFHETEANVYIPSKI